LPRLRCHSAGQAYKASFAQASRSLQEIDVLVNSAGLALGVAPAQFSGFAGLGNNDRTEYKKDWLRVTFEPLLPSMVTRLPGAYSIIGSTRETGPSGFGKPMVALKAFVQNFSRATACGLLGKHVRAPILNQAMAETNFLMSVSTVTQKS